MDQANVALQVINALYRREQQGADELSATLLAEDVAPKFHDVPVAYIRLLAARLLAIFYEPLTQDEVRSSTLKPLEKDDVCDYLVGTYRAEADQLRDDLDDRRASVRQ